MVKYLKPSEDFHFDPAFGFTGSAQGRHDARSHMGEADDDAYGNGSYVEADRPDLARGGRVNRGTPARERFEGDNANNLPLAKGGRVRRADGGAIMPTGRPANAAQAQGMGALGRATITMPVADAARAAQGLAQTSHAIGARQAMGGLRQAAAARNTMTPSGPPGAATALGAAPPPTGAVPGMAKGGRLRRAEGGYVGPGKSTRPPDDTQQPQMLREEFHDEPRPIRSRVDVPEVEAAKGGFIKGAIKHPGRMKRGAAREGVSTHHYMEEHKDAPGSLGAAARLGLRMTGGDLSPHRKKG